MLDQEDRELLVLAHPEDEVDELGRLLRIHPGRRLVEEEELRLRRERPSDLEAALVAVREVARVLVLMASEVTVREELARSLPRLTLLAPNARGARGCSG